MGHSEATEPRYVCVKCRREGPMSGFQDECRPGWTHDRLLRIETTAEDALRIDHYTQQLRKLAEVGAALCCYMPGAGNPEAWPESRCDCKYLPDLFSVLRREYAQLGGFTSEMTGCAEVRTAWRAMDTLRELAERRGGTSGDTTQAPPSASVSATPKGSQRGRNGV